jgi:cell division protein FtsB
MDLSNEIIILIVILVAALLYSKRNQWFGVNTIEITQKQTEAIAFYRREFENLSTKELIRKDNEEKLADEARIAIDELLSERSANPNNFMP